ncbi:MAG: glutathione peroxidase, partial [Bdellovibrio sp.]
EKSLESSKNPAVSKFFQLQLRGLDGKKVAMQEFQGKLLLIVNTASSCGFTPQMKDLVELQKKYKKRGLQVLGFPSNDFHQEEGSAQEIQNYAEKEFKVNFPLFEKASVRGPQAQPLFRYLTEQTSSFPKEVLWNFEKFLVSPSGQVLARYRSAFSPSNQELQAKIEEFLPKSL